MRKPVLIHLPHSSVHVPEDDRRDILLDDSELQAELLRLTDSYTDELFACSDAVMHKSLSKETYLLQGQWYL